MQVEAMFGSWNCGETFKIKDANRCILTIFETMFLELELLRGIYN